MRFTVNKLLLIGFVGLVLGACTAASGTEESSDNTKGEAAETAETVEAIEETEERSIVAEEMTTTFYPEVTRLRHLTEEDLEWYDIIMTRLNAIDDYSGDRETVYEIAEEYGEDPEELWNNWQEIVDAKWYGDNGNYAILPEDHHKLTEEIIEKNIVGEKVELGDGGSTFDDEKLITSAHREVDVDGESYRVSYRIEHSDDFKTAEIMEFNVDGEQVDL